MKRKKIKVLEVLHGLAYGGIETFVINISENIDNSRFQVDYALATDFPQFYEERVLLHGNKIYKTKNLGSFKNNWVHFFRLVKLIRTEHYDVVHAHIDYFNGINMLAAWLGGVKVRICHSHNTNSANAQNETESFVIKIYHVCMRILINLFSTVKAGCSENANKWLYGNSQGCQVIYNAIDLEQFQRTNFDRRKLQNKYGINPNMVNFVTVGRIAEQKNPLFLAKVICEYSKISDNFHFHWISTGRLKDQVEKILTRGGAREKVTFWGVRKDVPELLSCMDYFLFPSLWEGLGIVLVEAQTMGLKCFVSENIPQEADLGGLCTIYLNKGLESWAKEIANTIYMKKNSFIINQEELSRYDIKNMIKQIELLYKSSISGEFEI